MPSSPPDPCVHCGGRGRRIVFDTRPLSAGIPEQTMIDGNSVALWYVDGTTGVVRSWRCSPCDATGLAKRLGPSDVEATEEWIRRTGVRLPDPSSASVRGVVVRDDARLDVDQVAGELSEFSSTSRLQKASTAAARC